MRQIFCTVAQYIKLLFSIFVGFVASAKKNIFKLVKNRGFLLHSVQHWNHC